MTKAARPAKNRAAWPWRLLPAVLAAAALAAAAPGGAAAAEAREADVQAAYIYNFTRFVDWGAQAASSAAAHFDICALGRDPVNAPLSDLPKTEVAGKKIRVRLLGEEEKDLSSCRILFIGASERGSAAAITEKLGAARVLTVSALPGFARAGGMIGFVRERGRIRLEINLKAAREAGLKIDPRLLELSRLVSGSR